MCLLASDRDGIASGYKSAYEENLCWVNRAELIELKRIDPSSVLYPKMSTFTSLAQCSFKILNLG